MQTVDSLPMLHVLTKMSKGLQFPRRRAGKDGIISKRITLTTFLWEISRTKISVPTRQNALKKQTNNCRRDRKHSSYEDSGIMAYDTWNGDGNMMICTTGVIFIKASWSFFFVFQRQKWNRQEKKARNIKDEKMQESKNQGSNCQRKTKD